MCAAGAEETSESDIAFSNCVQFACGTHPTRESVRTRFRITGAGMSEYDRRERAASCLCQRQPGDSPSEATLGDIREQALRALFDQADMRPSLRAKRSNPGPPPLTSDPLDCFVASLLAMTIQSDRIPL